LTVLSNEIVPTVGAAEYRAGMAAAKSKRADQPKEAKAPAKTIHPDRLGFGLRLKAAREAKGLTQEAVAARFGVKKATVSAWETGRGAPDAYVLKGLSKLFDVSADALLWENSLSPAAMKVAAEYDGLSEKKRVSWDVLWLGFVAGAAPGGENLPLPPRESVEGNDDDEDSKV
jgi:transcriptional regulator with XRE-family HTH domain